MGLVIARRWGSTIVVAGDTNLVDAASTPPRVVQGVVKSRLLSPTLCVSFSGSLEWATRAMQAIAGEAENTGRSLDAALSRLERIHRDSNGSVEFIVAALEPQPVLVEISAGARKTANESAIGSPAALARFRNVDAASAQATGAAIDFWRAPDTGRVHDAEYAALIRSLRALIEDSDLPDAGGFIVPIAANGGRFEYLPYATTTSARITLDLTRAASAPVEVGRTGGARFALSFVGDPAAERIAIYNRELRCGAVFAPSEALLRAEPKMNLSPLGFEEQAGMATMFDVVPELIERCFHRARDGNLDGALADANAAVTRSSGREPKPLQCRAFVQATAGDHRAAVVDLSAAIELDRNDASLWSNRALAHAMLGRLDDAERDLTQTIALQPDSPTAYRQRARLLRAKGEDARAAADEEAAKRIGETRDSVIPLR